VTPLFENSCFVSVDPFTYLGAAILRKGRPNAKAESEADDQAYKVGVHCSFELGALPVTAPGSPDLLPPEQTFDRIRCS
jgi:hypothetical protein